MIYGLNGAKGRRLAFPYFFLSHLSYCWLLGELFSVDIFGENMRSWSTLNHIRALYERFL